MTEKKKSTVPSFSQFHLSVVLSELQNNSQSLDKLLRPTDKTLLAARHDDQTNQIPKTITLWLKICTQDADYG